MEQRLVAERRRYTITQDTHTHLFAQLLFPLVGNLTIYTEVEHCLDERNILLIPYQCEHTFYSHGQNEFLVMDIPKFLMGQEQDHGQPQQPQCIWYPFDEKWEAIRFLVLDALNQGASSSAVRDLFPYINRQLFQDSRPVSIRYIHEHFDEDIKIEYLAYIENYSVSHYSQWFRRETGRTPSVYLQEIRLQHAQRLLRETGLSIGSIAREVGLQHQASLTRLFQKHFGTTPAGYKKTVIWDKNADGSGKSGP